METPSRPSNLFPLARMHDSRITASGDAGRLPVFLTSFVGREHEIALGRSLLQQPDLRLLTVTGPGGIGKTRLAARLATESSPHFAGGVVFVPLASIQDPAMVMGTIATALDLQEFDGGSLDDSVATCLGTFATLLVLDNFEHLLDAAPALTKLLARCPRLTIMVTSRSLLRVEGEHAFPVPAFATPDATAAMTLADWLQVPVIALFVERARAVDPSRTWEQADIERLAEICGRLDGLPLAIELAASRIRHLSLAEINDRLNALLPLLTGGSQDHPRRLQTMRNAIAWSYDLLSPNAQTLLRQAAVFSGGFTLDAMAAVSGAMNVRPSARTFPNAGTGYDEAGSGGQVEDYLTTLIDANLLRREPASKAATARYRLLETIREFAWEQLVAHEEVTSARDAHATWFTTFAEQHEINELIPENLHSMDQLLSEHDNLRSALTWLHQSPDHEALVRLIAALGRFWLAQSSYEEGRRWFERALAAEPVPSSTRAARILVFLGMTDLFQDANEAAEVHLRHGLTACREHGEAQSTALALIGLASVAVTRGDGERSLLLLEEARQAATAIADPRLAGIMSGWVSINLAVAARLLGDDDLAEQHIAEALRRFQSEQFDIGTMLALGDQGDLAREGGDWQRALTLYQQALTVGRTDQARRIVVELLESVAVVAVHAGHLEHAALLFGTAAEQRERIGLRYRHPHNHDALERASAATRQGLSQAAFAVAWERGRMLTESEAVAEALKPIADRTPQPETSLTARETEILRLLATGMTDPEMADALFISVRTVEHHVANICRKLGVRTRTAAASTAIAAGLVSPGASA